VQKSVEKKLGVAKNTSFGVSFRGSWSSKYTSKSEKKGVEISHKTTCLPRLHRTEKRYTVGKIYSNDPEEEKRQKIIKAILNKLTCDNLERMLAQLLGLDYPTETTLDGLVSQIFDKAVLEPTFCELYALLTYCLSVNMCPNTRKSSVSSETANGENVFYSVSRGLVIKCQFEFEHGQSTFTRTDIEHLKQHDIIEGSDSLKCKMYKRKDADDSRAKWRAMGNIRFIGHLYRYGLITRKIISACIKSLLRNVEEPDPEDIEAMCKLITTVGYEFENRCSQSFKTHKNYDNIVRKYKVEMNSFMEKILILRNNTTLDSRIRFLCQEVLEMRKNDWKVRGEEQYRKKSNHREIYNRMLNVYRLKNLNDNSDKKRFSGHFTVQAPIIKDNTGNCESDTTTHLKVNKLMPGHEKTYENCPTPKLTDSSIIKMCDTISTNYAQGHGGNLVESAEQLVTKHKINPSIAICGLVMSFAKQKADCLSWNSCISQLSEICESNIFMKSRTSGLCGAVAIALLNGNNKTKILSKRELHEQKQIVTKIGEFIGELCASDRFELRNLVRCLETIKTRVRCTKTNCIQQEITRLKDAVLRKIHFKQDEKAYTKAYSIFESFFVGLI
jgi:translation initiation factor 4G